MTLVLVLAGLVLFGFLIDRLLLWMEWRGWIDYRRTYPGRINPGQVGPAFLAAARDASTVAVSEPTPVSREARRASPGTCACDRRAAGRRWN